MLESFRSRLQSLAWGGGAACQFESETALGNLRGDQGISLEASWERGVEALASDNRERILAFLFSSFGDTYYRKPYLATRWISEISFSIGSPYLM
jgi:hypothetical protein